MTWTINTLEVMAPKGQLLTQAPHWMHFFSSIWQIPVSRSMVMASTGHARRQGRISSAMALYGHAWAHFPHSLHLSGSIWARSRPMEMAPKLHAFWQALPIHFWQLSVTTNRVIGHSSQAEGITWIILSLCFPLGHFPSARRTLWRMISLSLYTQQRNWAFGPGISLKGISSLFSSSSPEKASFATSCRTLYLIFNNASSLVLILDSS